MQKIRNKNIPTSVKSLMELWGRWRKGLSGKKYFKKVRYSKKEQEREKYLQNME